jgi:hypothetical protein
MNSIQDIKFAGKIAGEKRQEIAEEWIKRMRNNIIEESQLGKTSYIYWLNDYNEYYRKQDFTDLIKRIQIGLKKDNVRVYGGWSEKENSLVLEINWNERNNKCVYWFY